MLRNCLNQLKSAAHLLNIRGYVIYKWRASLLDAYQQMLSLCRRFAFETALSGTAPFICIHSYSLLSCIITFCFKPCHVIVQDTQVLLPLRQVSIHRGCIIYIYNTPSANWISVWWHASTTAAPHSTDATMLLVCPRHLKSFQNNGHWTVPF